MKILITGTAGFIGFHLAKALLERGDEVIGLDNLSGIDVNLLQARLSETGISCDNLQYGTLLTSDKYENYRFILLDIMDKEVLFKLFEQEDFDCVCHFSAKTGIHRSLECPEEYISTNVIGFGHILEACRHFQVQRLFYASSSSVYGANSPQPYAINQPSDSPISMYAATKKMNELMAHTYSHLYRLSTTGLRLFTVYGPWGRPDMAPFLFVKSIIEGEPIKVYNNGNMSRDFTYVEDVIHCILLLLDAEVLSEQPYQLYNIGGGRPTGLLDFISMLEKQLNKIVPKQFLPLRNYDMITTFADLSSLKMKIAYQPTTSMNEGIRKFIEWYKNFYHIM